MISKIANEIVNETILLNWKFYVLLVLITFVATCISSYVFPYIAARGKSLATKADFNLLLTQLQTTTATTETIKRSITHNDWALKEFKLLKRNKLEELLIALYDVEQWVDDQTKNVLFIRDGYEKSVTPIKKLNLIGLLYFTELTDELANFEKSYKAYKALLLRDEAKISTLKFEEKNINIKLDFAINHKQQDVDGLMVNLKSIAEQNAAIFNDVKDEYLALYKNQLAAISVIENKAGLLMQEYIKVETGEASLQNA